MLSCLISFMIFSVSAASPPDNYDISFPDHPRLAISKAELPQIREKVETYDWARQTYEGLRRNADRWLEQDISLPDRGSQWWHWYSCEEDGARLHTRSATEHVCPVCGTVYTGYPYDDVVLARDHSALSWAIWDCGFVYQFTGDLRYADRAKQILLAYADKYLTYPLHNIHGDPKVGGGRVGPQSLDESTWLIPVVQGADMVWETLTAEERKTLRDKLFYPAAVDVIQKHRMGIHNIQCWKNSAVGLTGFLFGDPALVWDAVESDHGYRQQMAEGVRPDGPWFEGAWGYHFYTLSALWGLTEAAYRNGIDLYGPELKSMFDAPIRFAMPNLKLPAFNDSHPVDLKGRPSLYEIAYARYGDPEYAQVLTERAGREALLYGEPEVEGAETTAQESRNYPQSGYAILTQGAGEDATWLCLDYGPHGGGHGHPDKLNFVLYSRGQVIAPDPGTAPYGVPIQREWYRQTIAHNTLTVDEKSQQPATGHALAFDAAQNAVLLAAGDIYPGVEFYRQAILLDSDHLLLMDQVYADSERTFDIAYHNYGRWDETPDGTPWTPPEKGGYMHIRDARSHTIEREGMFGIVLESGNRISIGVAVDGSTELIWGTGVGSNAEERVPMIIARQRGRTARVVWLISLADDRPTLSLEPSVGDRRSMVAHVSLSGEDGVWSADLESIDPSLKR